MKYNQILQFDPINEVVKFGRTNEETYRQNLISTFVFSKAYEENIVPLICRNLDYSKSAESFGMQVVGSYGTGKSHLMSLISLIAEDASLLDKLTNDKAKQELRNIAGKYKVIRFELGTDQSLWDVVSYKIEEALKSYGVDFTFVGYEKLQYQERLQKMMGVFEEAFPSQGLMVVVDEMLAYLKGRGEPAKLNTDLQVLQALGQCSDNSKFRIIFGVQELIYNSPEFQFAANMLGKVKDRFREITITKEDVSFVVKKRLLKKDEYQKDAIRKHLTPYTSLFSDMHSRLEEYVELYPVHPSYFENFQLIKIGKSQREILKNLSQRFTALLAEEIPTDNPGLITYDMYWDDIVSSHDLMAIPDVRKIKEVMDIVYDRISTNLTGPRAGKQTLTKRIAAAAAIKILQDDLHKQNGINAETLIDDICYTDMLADERDMLIDTIVTYANILITATNGQYFDQHKDSSEYHLRIEGGVNFDQRIKDYAATQMSPSMKDEYFFQFLSAVLPIEVNPYRSGFKIWPHNIEWKSRHTYRSGYIFMGNPKEKSTTQPRQHFYLYFMPIFDNSKKTRNAESDELYFIMDDISEEFKSAITLYGAAMSLMSSADTAQRPIYRQKCDELRKKATIVFDRSFVQTTMVEYCGEQKPMAAYPLMSQGASKEQIVSLLASSVFEKHFNEESPNYPKFQDLSLPLAEDNFQRHIKAALSKIAAPNNPDRQGEAILSGLGLWEPGKLDISQSIYARQLMAKLKSKGENQVLNRDEIIFCYWQDDNIWLSNDDFRIEAEFQFLVMATLTALGEIEITLPSGASINATNISTITTLKPEDLYHFSHVRRPKAVNLAAIREMFIQITGKDYSLYLKEDTTYVELLKAVDTFASRAAKAEHEVGGEKIAYGITLISEVDAAHLRSRIVAFKGFCDQLRVYSSPAKMNNFKFTIEEIHRVMQGKTALEEVEQLSDTIKSFDGDMQYLRQAMQYLPQGAIAEAINTVKAKLPVVFMSKDKHQVDALKEELTETRKDYAKWYLKEYLKHHINELDEKEKQKLLASDAYKVCQQLADSELVNGASFAMWNDRAKRLVLVDNNVTQEAIMQTPYHEFNPRDYAGLAPAKLEGMGDELKEIYANFDIALHELLDDPTVQKNVAVLKPEEQKMLKDYKADMVTLTADNVMQMRTLLESLNKGFSKVEITADALRSTFSRPMSPDEAIEAFKKFVDTQSHGKDRGKVRIILR